MIVLKGSDQQAAQLQAAKIQAALKQARFIDEGKLTASIGVASLKSGDSRYDLLNRVDECLHKAKSSGGNCTQS